jgi:hypothetical protein
MSKLTLSKWRPRPMQRRVIQVDGVRNNGQPADYARSMRRAVERLGGTFTMGTLVSNLRAHEPNAHVMKWINCGYVGSQVATWRDNGEVELSDAATRTFKTTSKWQRSDTAPRRRGGRRAAGSEVIN